MKTPGHRLRIIPPPTSPEALRRLGLASLAPLARLPTAPREGGVAPRAPHAKKPKATKARTAKRKRAAKKKSSTSSGLSKKMIGELHDWLMAELQGGDILIAIQAICQQIVWANQAQSSALTSSAGSYQRMGGF